MIAAQMARHELVGVDRAGETCACGVRSDSWQEHLADIALALLGAPKAKREPLYTLTDVALTKRLLNGLGAAQDALGAELDATGLTGFVERSEWLIAHRTPEAALAWRLKWALLTPEPARRRGPSFKFTAQQLQIAAQAIQSERMAS